MIFLKSRNNLIDQNIIYLKKDRWYLLLSDTPNYYNIIDETGSVNSYHRYSNPLWGHFYSSVEIRKMRIKKLLSI